MPGNGYINLLGQAPVDYLGPSKGPPHSLCIPAESVELPSQVPDSLIVMMCLNFDITYLGNTVKTKVMPSTNIHGFGISTSTTLHS